MLIRADKTAGEDGNERSQKLRVKEIKESRRVRARAHKVEYRIEMAESGMEGSREHSSKWKEKEKLNEEGDRGEKCKE